MNDPKQILAKSSGLLRILESGKDGFAALIERPVEPLRIIASWGGGWDHVSVSLKNRCPTWDEMALVKRVFFRADECVMQLHPPEANYVNHHPFCLHLWRPQNEKIPQPPSAFVGPKTQSETGKAGAE